MKPSSIYLSPEGREQIFRYYDRLLGKMNVPYETMTLNTCAGPTSVITAGDPHAPPVVLLHGSSINSTMWISDLRKLYVNYRVYALDLPGEPGKSAEVQLPFDTDDYAHWLRDAMDALSLSRAVVMGASLGAWLSVKYAVLYPGRVSALVLLCPAGIGPQNDAFKDIALSLLSKGPEGVDELFAQINGGPIPEIMLTYQKLIATQFQTRKEAVPLFTDEELQALTMPILLFMGGRDILIDGPKTVERCHRMMPAAEVVFLPEKGHSLTGLTGPVLEFLDRVG